ncbi:MAG: GXWXG domain-containing protein, partial [Gammaproteobacteria bacterium]|nr:GXWXG domain-containing protein [Gammaproteobacteria bacterium]
MNKNNSTKIHTTEETLQLFDSLEPVDIDFMIGKWRGEGFPTNHRLDGILEAYHWHGKQFLDPENVHPLVFSTLFNKQVYVNPVFMGPTLKIPVPKSP